MTPQINIHFSQDEFDLIEKFSTEIGFVNNQLCKYYILLGVRDGLPPPKTNLLGGIIALESKMVAALKKLSTGDTFIVSALFDPSEWPVMTTSEKYHMSHKLKSYVTTHPKEYSLLKKIGNINLYIVL